MTRLPAFTMPLALFMIAFVALNVTRIYDGQNMAIKTLYHLDEQAEFDRQSRELILKSTQMTPQTNGQFARRMLILDGLYNLSHLVSTGALDTRHIDRQQVLVLEKILSLCDAPVTLAQSFATQLQKIITLTPRVGILDLFAALDIPSELQLKLLACVRLSTPLNKLNLYYVDPTVLAVVLDSSILEAQTIAAKIQSGTIDTISLLRSYFDVTLGRKMPIASIQTLTILPNYDHIGVYWTQDEKTFAYVDVSQDQSQTWTDNWHIILWLPKGSL